MSLMDDILRDDAHAFIDPDSMPGVELVTYNPHGGTPREIYAVVDRDPPERINQGEAYRSALEITVSNHATLGIVASAINGEDTVTVAYRLGGDEDDHHIIGEPISQDNGMLRLELA